MCATTTRLRFTGRFFTAAITLLMVHAGPSGVAAGRPDIIIILSDDMGFSDLGCYGGEIHTPKLDGLAQSGLRFTQFYNTARCCPTRACLLTGLYPHQAGMGHMTYDGKKPGYEGDLSHNAVTIAEVLKSSGYGTYMAGKWHVTRFAGKDGPKQNWPRQRGFDRFYGTITGAGSYYDPTTLCRDNTFITPENDPEYRPPRFYYTDAISDNAIRFIRGHSRSTPGRPFFIYVAYTAAHWPMHALPEDIAKYHGKYSAGYEPVRAARWARAKELGLVDPRWEITPQAGDWEKVKHKEWEARCMEVYAAMVDRMDQGIGRIIAELRTLNRFDNTLIFFLQDNGGCAEGMGRQSNANKIKDVRYQSFGPDDLQPQIWPPMQTRDGRPVRTGPDVMPGPEDTYVAYGRNWANVSNTPFREYKHWVHEGGISTPLIVHWPAGISVGPENRLVREPGHLIDLMATCVDVAKAKYPAEYKGEKIRPMEGVSLAPLFTGGKLDRKQPLFWEHEGNRAIRVGQWKLVAKGPAGPWELYDMTTDRTETQDLAAQHPEQVKEMAAEWETWAKRARVLPWIWRPPYGAAANEGPVQTRFMLKSGDELSGDDAPRVAGRSLHLTAAITRMVADGVIVAQGGSADGFALYLKDGRLCFSTRIGGSLTTATSSSPLPSKPAKIGANLSADGNISVLVDGREIASGKASGPLRRQPIDGLQVGRDLKGAVGDYRPPFAFTGQIDDVTLELGR